MDGRLYYAQIDITYSGGRLLDEDRDALFNALRRGSWRIFVATGEQLYTVIVVSAKLRADNPLDAIAALNRHLDQALLAAGLVEKFDITGKVLRVRPISHGPGVVPA
jgi:hypothetical protein